MSVPYGDYNLMVTGQNTKSKSIFSELRFLMNYQITKIKFFIDDEFY